MLTIDDFEIKRSPARVCWHILFRGQFICTADTKAEAERRMQELQKVG
jgi:hypothetical protein